MEVVPLCSALSLKGTKRSWRTWAAEHTEAYGEAGKGKFLVKNSSTKHRKKLISDVLFSAVPASLVNGKSSLEH